MSCETAPRYRLRESLGKGGMGEVFLADDTQLGRKVAIKFIRSADDDRALDRLYREARSAAALDHPYICKIIEITEVDGRTGIVMEHVSGETLQAALSRSPISPKRALEIASEVAEALEEAHKKRVVHRDLKPANVMLTEQGHVKVMDFGLAKQTSVGSSDDQTTGSLTDPGTRVGTPGYMAPEQLLGGQSDERSDIFAFGVVLYELLAGVHPFRRSSPSGTMAAILRDPHAPVGQNAKDTSDTARITLDRLLAKEPERRYQSFQAVRTDLGQLLQEASGPIAAAPPVSVETTAGRTPYVGRESERAEALRLLEDAIGGKGSLLLLGGEPGVGKTRLAEEVLAEARGRGCLAFTGRCYEMEGTPPFIPWVEIIERSARIVPPAAFREVLGETAPEMAKLVPELRRMFPDIPQAVELPPEQQRRFLFNSVLEAFERGTRATPHALLIDDLHWADESTLLLLQHFAQQLAQLPLLILGTYRDVDLDVDRPFAETLETLTRQRLAQRLALSRLDEAGVANMLHALSQLVPPTPLVKAVFAETEGNPFFVEEVYQHLSEEGRLFGENGAWRTNLRVEDLDVPEGIKLVIGRRLKRLSDEARRVLMTAAIIGRSFDVRLLEAVGDAEGDALLVALEEAEAAKLIVTIASGRDIHWEFAHGLIRQTLENSLSLMRRQRAHLRVAEGMERAFGDEVERHAADVAQHLYQAGVAADPAKTVRFLTLAGDQGMEAGAFDEARRSFDDALSILDEQENRQEFADLQYRKGLALRSVGRVRESVDELALALSAYEQLEEVEGISRTVVQMADQTSWLPGETHLAHVVARRGLDAVGRKDARARSRMLALVARFASLAGVPFEDVRDLLVEAETLALKLKHSDLEAELLTARTRFHWSYLQLPQALDVGRHARELHSTRGEIYEVAEINWQLAWCALLTGQLHIFDDLTGAEPFAVRAGHLFSKHVFACADVRYYLAATGDLAGAAERATRDLEWAEQNVPTWRGYSQSARAASSFFGGDWDAARDDYKAAAELEPRSFLEGHHRSIAVVTDAYVGVDVSERLDRSFREVAALRDENPLGRWQESVNTVEALAVSGRAGDAFSLYRQVAGGIAKGSQVSMHLRLWQMVAGIAAACGQKWDVSEGHFQTALRQAKELPHVIAQPEVRRWYARMLLDRNAAGDRDKARTLLGEATEMYRTIGIPKHLEMVEKMSAEL